MGFDADPGRTPRRPSGLPRDDVAWTVFWLILWGLLFLAAL